MTLSRRKPVSNANGLGNYMTNLEILLIMLSALYCVTWFRWLGYWNYAENAIDEFTEQKNDFDEERQGLHRIIKEQDDTIKGLLSKGQNNP